MLTHLKSTLRTPHAAEANAISFAGCAARSGSCGITLGFVRNFQLFLMYLLNRKST